MNYTPELQEKITWTEVLLQESVKIDNSIYAVTGTDRDGNVKYPHNSQLEDRGQFLGG